jgi:non-ribosomal peptide synthetase-like protein
VVADTAFRVADPAGRSPVRTVGPRSGTERVLAEVLADLLDVEQVSVEGHFFDDMAADSLVMAHFCARLRKRADAPSVSMKDIYRNPTIRSLAAALADATPVPTPAAAAAPAPVEVRKPAGTGRYVLCGALQLLIFLGYSSLAAVVAVTGYEWISAGPGLLDVYLRSVAFGAGAFLAMCTLPILVKWLLVGRWKRRQIPVWSLAYVRFWTVKTLIRANPLVLFVGSPLYVLYLRALGAKVGKGVAIFSRTVPVCTDLLTIGAGTVIRKDSFFTCYRAHAGMIETGAVTIGKDVVVGEVAVLDIDTSLGDGAQLGHASSLHPGQAVPDGERWHGSPARRTSVDFRTVPPTRCGTWRRASYSVLQLLNVLVLYTPLAFGVVVVLLTEVPQLAALLDPAPAAMTSWTFYRDALVASTVLFFGPMLVGLLVVGVVPRVLGLAIRPDRVYRLYGFHFGVHRTIAVLTNVKFFKTLFGDSSAIVHYLRYLGYDLNRVQQTGSNFGTQVKHETPYFSSVGSGTMVADGLSIINADFSSTSFRVSRVSIGARNFLGNHIAYPAQGRTGDNCLLGTKVMVPIDGKLREGVGLLGSPSFEIPRSVERDSRVDRLVSRAEMQRRLAAKNRHNAATIVMYLLARWVHVFGVALVAAVAADLYHALGAAAVVLANVLVLLFTAAYFVLVERLAAGFRALRPLYCSIYDRSFWRHERFWKGASVTAYLQVLNGTPFKNVAWRLLGVRLGRRLFDDGCGMPEKTLVTIGDDVTLNAASIIQCHSQEDGAFKSDRITIGSGVTVGVGAWVHYGVTMGDDAILAADSFLMKGEDVPPHARWGGNPARESRDALPARRVVPPLPTVPVTRVRPARRRAPALVAAALLVVVAMDVLVIRNTAESRSWVITLQIGRVTPAQAAAPAQPPVVPSPAQIAVVPSPELQPQPQPAPTPAPAETASAPATTAPVAASTAAVFGLADVPRLERGLVLGSAGAVVVTLQQQLQHLGYHQGPADGRLDEQTVDAVRRFQADAGVAGDPSGTVGKPTAVALLAAGPRTELATGATGEDVHRLQHALVVALGRALPVNGSFRSTTRQAVSDYQSSHGLPVDGTATEQTWAALQGGR